jgi:hypothetical protein
MNLKKLEKDVRNEFKRLYIETDIDFSQMSEEELMNWVIYLTQKVMKRKTKQ